MIAVDLELADADATAALGIRLAELAQPGDILALRGELGTGKTSLARAFIQARAGAPIAVPSPTFTLAQSYDLSGGMIWHVDLYRLTDPDQAEELGLEEAFADAISLIEWPERLGARLPAHHLAIALSHRGEGRLARLEGGPEWRDRLAMLAKAA